MLQKFEGYIRAAATPARDALITASGSSAPNSSTRASANVSGGKGPQPGVRVLELGSRGASLKDTKAGKHDYVQQASPSSSSSTVRNSSPGVGRTRHLKGTTSMPQMGDGAVSSSSSVQTQKLQGANDASRPLFHSFHQVANTHKHTQPKPPAQQSYLTPHEPSTQPAEAGTNGSLLSLGQGLSLQAGWTPLGTPTVPFGVPPSMPSAVMEPPRPHVHSCEWN